jgi:peroxiredoxin
MKLQLRLLSGIFLILMAGVLVAWANTDESDKVKVGEVAPSFTILTPDGEVTSESLKGKVVLLNFFATWCPPCLKELPVLQEKVWEKYKDNKDFVLLVVGREHSIGDLEKFAKEKGFDLPFCPDENREIFGQFASQSIPRNYIINKGGKIVYASKGFSPAEFDHMISVLGEHL